jgi:hypothetical protein
MFGLELLLCLVACRGDRKVATEIVPFDERPLNWDDHLVFGWLREQHRAGFLDERHGVEGRVTADL